MTTRKALYCILAILSMCVFSFPQERRLMSGSGGGDTYQFFYATVVEPAEPQVKPIGGGVMVGRQIHRIMIDKDGRAYFGYDVLIEVLPEPDTYRITFGQLTAKPNDFRQLDEDAPTYAQLAAPDWGGPAVRTIRGGEVLALTLLTNKRTGQKIVDYVTVERPGEQPERLGPLPLTNVFEEGTPRDFRADDAWLDIRPKSATLDGNSIQLPGKASGALPYLSVPNQGRFILSLTRQLGLGFRKAGEIRGSTLSFTIDGHTLNLISDGRIAPGVGPFNLYILHQSAWSRIGVGVANPRELEGQQLR